MNVLGTIKIDGKNKTKEEIKKEAMEQFSKEIDKALNNENTAEEDKNNDLAKLIIDARESEDKTGFGVHVDIEGEYADLMTMLVITTATALEAINEGENERSTIFPFIAALITEWNNRIEKGEK